MGRLEEKGAILGIVVIYMLLITFLGYGLLNLSGIDTIEVGRNLDSTQAFWLAEAGIQKAITKLPDTTSLNESLGPGKYTTNIDAVGALKNRWEITSTGTMHEGTVHERKRTIRVTVGPIRTVIRSNGPVPLEEGNPTVVGTVVENDETFSFDIILGKTEGDVRNMAIALGHDYVYTKDETNPGVTIEGVTWFTMIGPDEEKKTLTLAGNWTGSGLLVVDGNLSIKGTGTFTGILWVNGNLTVSAADVVINGSVFLLGDTTIGTKLVGGPDIFCDAQGDQAIDDVYEYINSDNPGATRRIISWQEIVS